MPEIKYNDLPLAGRMAANADEDKKKQFMKGFNRALGSPQDQDDEEDGKKSSVLAAMKRVIVGG